MLYSILIQESKGLDAFDEQKIKNIGNNRFFATFFFATFLIFLQYFAEKSIFSIISVELQRHSFALMMVEVFIERW